MNDDLRTDLCAALRWRRVAITTISDDLDATLRRIANQLEEAAADRDVTRKQMEGLTVNHATPEPAWWRDPRVRDFLDTLNNSSRDWRYHNYRHRHWLALADAIREAKT